MARVIAYNYWCRYHGRYENTEDEEACLTTEEIQAEEEALRKRRTDPPCFRARVLKFFGIEVKP